MRRTHKIRRMALLHRVELNPTKLELLAVWLPGRPWYRGGPGAGLERLATFRFDDPEGEVGIETLLIGDGDGPLHHVPLTYRGAPLPDAEGWLVGTAEHGVLGRRWVYDACGDPVYAAVLAGAIAGRIGQAEEYFEVDGRREVRAPNMTIALTTAIEAGQDGDHTVITTEAGRLAVIRRPDGHTRTAGPTLTGTWPAQPAPLPLAYALPS